MASTKYIYKGVVWSFICDPEKDGCDHNCYVHGPYCPKCHNEMVHKEAEDNPFVPYKESYIFLCLNKDCNFEVITPYTTIFEFKHAAHGQYHAKARSLKETISLDLPPTKIKTRDEDENYFVATELTQKEGRRLAIVYVGEKKDKQNSKDYSQIFIDLDQKQVRYDKNNKFPGEILTAVICEFDNNKVSVNFKKNKTK